MDEYQIKEAVSKNIVTTNLEVLNENEVNRYVIYQAISEALPYAKSLDELKGLLMKKKIETIYKYKSGTNDLQSISFALGKYKYKGSEVDRGFSIKNLIKTIHLDHRASLLKPKSKIDSSELLPKRKPSGLIEKKIRPNNLMNDLLKQNQQDPVQMQSLLPKKERKKQ